MQIQQLTHNIARSLQDAKITSFFLEARLIIAHSLGISQEKLLINGEKILNSDELEKIEFMVSKRLKHQPIAYILGYKEFYDNEFRVTPDVLIPRSDTELLVDIVLKQAGSKQCKLLELGVGSGCVIISLLKLLPDASGTGLDYSLDALKIAQQNADYLLPDPAQLQLLHSDWYSALPKSDSFDYIISNPPYISEEEQKVMAKETLLYEPREALFADKNGLDAYHKIAYGAGQYLKPNGKIFVEIGYKQSEAVIDIFKGAGYQTVVAYSDLSSIVRVLEFSS